MTVNRIGRKNFLTKLVAKRTRNLDETRYWPKEEQIPVVFRHSSRVEQGKK